MKSGESSEPGLFNSLPSVFVLPVARVIYLIIALLSLLAVVGGIVFAIYLQLSTAGQPRTIPVPPPYQGSLSVPNPPLDAVDLSVVAARLNPPTNVRFAVTAGTISTPLKPGTVLGHFMADTPNQIASYPEGVSILGGPDAERFMRARDDQSSMVGLAVTPLLAAEIAEALRDIKDENERTFQIRVAMRDRFGTTSAAADVMFSLHFAPESSAGPEPRPDAQTEPTEIQKIAGEVAKIVEPTVNPARFSAYEKATQVPRRCGASDSDPDFLANYRSAVDDARPKLTAANVEAFYTGLCEAWKEVLQRQADARKQAEQLIRAARDQAELARANAEEYNNDLQRQHTAQVFRAEAYTVVTLSVIGGALGIFLSVSLVLAFLAIESHSRAVRLAIETMVRVSEQGKPVDSVEVNPS